MFNVFCLGLIFWLLCCSPIVKPVFRYKKKTCFSLLMLFCIWNKSNVNIYFNISEFLFEDLEH